MKIAERIYNKYFAPKHRPQVRREYAGAKVSRLNSGWTTMPTTANYETRMAIDALIARSRQMCRDEPLFKRTLKILETNVIGHQGIQLQCRAYNDKKQTTLNAPLNKRVQDAFWLWGHKETCSISGKMDWISYQKLFVRSLFRDGSVLVLKVVDPSLEWGFALKFVDVTYLDKTYNEELPNGNRVIMSVEIDALERPVAYWLTTPPSDMTFTQRRERRRVRVPAENAIYAYLVEDGEDQVHGIPQFYAVVVAGKNRYGYNEGVITSARATANWVGFIKQEATDDVMFEGEEDPETGLRANIEIDNRPGQFNLLEPGMDVTQIDPKQPTQNHAEFAKKLEAEIGTGVDIPYFVLTGDMTAVNYSSARVGLGEFRDMCRGLQTFVATHFCREVYHAWIKEAWLAGKITIAAKDYAEVQNPTWRPRGWQFVDPQKEIAANVEGLQNNILSLTQTLADRGIDIEEHFQDIQREKLLAEKYGITLEYGRTESSKAVSAQPDDEGGDPLDDEELDDEKKRAIAGNGHSRLLTG